VFVGVISRWSLHNSYSECVLSSEWCVVSAVSRRHVWPSPNDKSAVIHTFTGWPPAGPSALYLYC